MFHDLDTRPHIIGVRALHTMSEGKIVKLEFWLSCLVLVISLSITTTGVAGFEEGIAAFDRGEYKIALREFRLSAAQGDARAQYNIAVMYRTGQGVTQSNQEADRWYRNAAELGHVEAQFSLGLMYHEGFIGKMYVKGQGIKKNYLMAHKWYNIAALNGHRLSKKQLGLVEGKMTSEEIGKANKLAKNWRSTWPIELKKLSYSEQISFEKSMKPSCFKKQKSGAVNSGFEDWQIDMYCDCTVRYVSSNILVSDIVQMTKRKKFNRRTMDLLQTSGQKCMADLSEKWGFN